MATNLAQKPTASPDQRVPASLESVVIRFAGDSGDGMQLTGTQFTHSTALMGTDLATFPDFPAEIRAVPFGEGGGLLFATDLTEKKELEERFLRAQRLECIGSLASGVAHDLNNILAPILLVSGLLKTKLVAEQDQNVLTMVESSAKRGAAIVRQLLMFSRGLSGERLLLRCHRWAPCAREPSRAPAPVRSAASSWRRRSRSAGNAELVGSIDMYGRIAPMPHTVGITCSPSRRRYPRDSRWSSARCVLQRCSRPWPAPRASSVSTDRRSASAT